MTCRLLLVLLFSLAAAGLGHAQPVPEAQINAAIPLSPEAQTALTQVQRLMTGHRRAQLDDELQTKLRLRALQCSQNWGSLSGSTLADIQREHGGDPCFAQFDAGLAQWLGLRSVSVLLAQPALRPVVRDVPRFIQEAAGSISRAQFAADAGVALLASYKDLEVMDLAGGTPIYTGTVHDETIASLSPNGRVYAVLHEGDIRLYDALNGTLLASPRWCVYLGQCGFFWLDGRSVIIFSEPDHASEVYDLQTDRTAPLAAGFQPIIFLTRSAAGPSTFVAFTDSGTTQFQLSYADDAPRVQLLNLESLRLNLSPSYDGGPTADGRWYVFTSNDRLYTTSTAPLHTQPVDLGTFVVQRVVPTSDPDKLIVAGYIKGGTTTWQFYEYSLQAQTLAPLDSDKLPGTRFVFGPAVDTLFAITNAALTKVSDLAAEAPMSRQAFVAQVEGISSGLQQHSVVTLATPSGGFVSPPRYILGSPLRGPMLAMQPTPGPIADLARDAQIIGVGVYAAESSKPGDLSSGGGTVIVRVQPSPNPVMVVLASFASINWQLQVAPGVRLKAVLLTGPHGSSVSGQGAARVVAIGSAYSFDLGSYQYQQLQNEVYTWTGKRISLFQCGYQASSFSVFGM